MKPSLKTTRWILTGLSTLSLAACATQPPKCSCEPSTATEKVSKEDFDDYETSYFNRTQLDKKHPEKSDILGFLNKADERFEKADKSHEHALDPQVAKSIEDGAQ